MRVFVSWSGDLSRRVAETLRQYLPLMIQGADAFMSKHDLESGTRWSLELAKELEESSFGILCLTPDNMDSRWILFEAGALTKHVAGRACGLLIGGLKPTDVSGPLSQFQNRTFTQEEVQALLRDINAQVAKPLGAQQVDTIFEKWWPDIQRAYDSALTSSAGKAERTPRDQRDFIEEILTRIRSIEGAIERKSMSFTLGEVFDRTWAGLTRQQKHLLLEVARPQEADNPVPLRDLRSGDVEWLEKSGLVLEKGGSWVVMHKALQEYLLNKAESVR